MPRPKMVPMRPARVPARQKRRRRRLEPVPTGASLDPALPATVPLRPSRLSSLWASLRGTRYTLAPAGDGKYLLRKHFLCEFDRDLTEWHCHQSPKYSGMWQRDRSKFRRGSRFFFLQNPAKRYIHYCHSWSPKRLKEAFKKKKGKWNQPMTFFE